MKNRLNGFVEGTTHITTGDKMKTGDHRRDKRNCYYYKNEHCELLSRKCTGSSHCDYYNDGIKVRIIEPKIPNTHTHEKRLINFLETLRNEINHKSLEGQYISLMILKKYRLTRELLDNAKKQNETFEYKKTELIREVNSYNEKLKNRCILFGLLIITAPFCYSYYKNNLRNIDKEISSLKLQVVDDDLQESVKNYNAELNRYKQSSEISKSKEYYNDKNEHFFTRALYSYNNKDFERFFEFILKSIKDSANVSAILYLANLFKNSQLLEKNEYYYVLLLLYASYLGDKKSSRALGDMLIERARQNNRDSKLGEEFVRKSH